MKILLTNSMADELLNNEDQIKNQLGAYRPHYDPITKSYLPVIKCWPLEDFKGDFNQERWVIPGMENEIADIALAIVLSCFFSWILFVFSSNILYACF